MDERRWCRSPGILLGLGRAVVQLQASYVLQSLVDVSTEVLRPVELAEAALCTYQKRDEFLVFCLRREIIRREHKCELCADDLSIQAVQVWRKLIV
jgi:hypothetical protein